MTVLAPPAVAVAPLATLPGGSVGGPMTVALLAIFATLALGLYEAWSNERGPLGWIASAAASLAGGIAGVSCAELLAEPLMMRFPPSGQLYVGLTIGVICLLLGSWAALKVVNRFR